MSLTHDRPESLIGRSVLRREDLPVLRGEARYTDDEHRIRLAETFLPA